ncbi:hypothetical protein L226DRAFT_543431 [Lentinus tigrinus ALCF2SS1-7]|uniref:U6 snRNA phosphodiesterase 1 n=1 Tax=Lentinus tigrinus ALCF2SS1-6 TaxID=1328759 RepID=A0A5C2SN41_9APHY|nr:hypothetical protein L227DRAFT_583233 [Lentinus tigrinus ALCF2SS1-6]RPD79411.1 hypothetical protein L226DRAFT_543431 [Lentinus tigrinus ALCF2SS1-7]
MKRPALVEYSSSDEEAPNPCSTAAAEKLPSLSAHLLPHAPVDNPALHQGRRRTTPHVEGQFAAYVYVPVVITKNSKLFELLSRMISAAQQSVPTLHPIGLTEADIASPDGEGPSSVSDVDDVEFHISLTRPTYLRAHQREEFKRAIRTAARTRVKFPASLSTVSELTNDERTRTFLTLEVGAGHESFKELSDSLTPALRSIRQKEFYEQPRFHISIAWALLDGSRDSAPAPTSEPLPSPAEASTPPLVSSGDIFRTIPSFPPSLVPQLQTEFGRELVSPMVGTFEAEEVCVRIGKDVGKWKLSVV